MPFGVHSEVGRLRKVMVHRPGLEHTRLTPSNAEELLFDDVLSVARAKAEHEMFCEVMRERGVEVFEAETLLAEALAKPETRDWVCGHILGEREVGITAAQRAYEWVQTADAALATQPEIADSAGAVRSPAGLLLAAKSLRVTHWRVRNPGRAGGRISRRRTPNEEGSYHG